MPNEAWNKGLLVGQKHPFTPQQVRSLARWLEFSQLLLLCLGVDSLLRGSDLLKLRLKDVMTSNRHPKPELLTLQRKTKLPVRAALSVYTQSAVAVWASSTDAAPSDFLFAPIRGDKSKPISTSFLRRRVKQWAEHLGLATENYSSHSLRRTKPAAMYANGERIETIRILLGHTSIVSTQSYLGIHQAHALEAARRHDLFKEAKPCTSKI